MASQACRVMAREGAAIRTSASRRSAPSQGATRQASPAAAKVARGQAERWLSDNVKIVCGGGQALSGDAHARRTTPRASCASIPARPSRAGLGRGSRACVRRHRILRCPHRRRDGRGLAAHRLDARPAPAPRCAPAAAARTGGPGRTARRSRAGRPPSPRSRCRSAIRSMPNRPSRSEKSAGMDVDALVAGAVEQQRRRRLDEAEAAVGELARLDAQIGQPVEREPEAELAERRQAFVLDRPHGADRGLREFAGSATARAHGSPA